MENYQQVYTAMDYAWPVEKYFKKTNKKTFIKLFVFARFVGAMVSYYYPTASDVQRDSELQEWISEVFTHGFLGNKDSGKDEHF